MTVWYTSLFIMRSTRIVSIYNMKDDTYETAEEVDGLFSVNAGCIA